MKSILESLEKREEQQLKRKQSIIQDFFILYTHKHSGQRGSYVLKATEVKS